MTEKDVTSPTGGRDVWFTSSFSGAGASCVEVRFGSGGVSVRDSKDRRDDRPVIGVSGPGWTSFLDTVR